MKSTVLALFAAVMLVVSTAAIVNAGNQNAHQLDEILIEKDFHHLGDDGPSWEGAFRLRSSQLDAATTAHLELWLSGTGGGEDSVMINGESFALPDSHYVAIADFPFSSKVVLSFPLAWLQSGMNTISVGAGQLGPNPPASNTHDDFDFGEVVLLLSS